MVKLERRRPRWLPALAAVLAVLVAGCGPSGGGDGGHRLRVEAVANNHARYHRDGEPVFAVTTVQAG